ncbi:MAG: hypothetical protein U1E40_04380 [Amaricoccus sp.]
MRTPLVKAGLAAALLAASLAGAAAPAAASSVVVDWSGGHHYWWPGPGAYYGWSPHPVWFNPWWPRYETYPVWAGGDRLETVRHELSSDDLRLQTDRNAGRVGHAEFASLVGEDAAIRSEANRDAAFYGGLSYDQFVRLQGEVHALSGEIARADGGPVA